MAGKQISRKKSTEISIPNYLEEHAGEGTTSTMEEMSLPFLRIVESLSPQCKKTDARYDKDAEPGDIINTVSGELFSGEDGVAIVGCAKHYEYPMFKVREAGGGFLGMGDDRVFQEESTRDELGRDVLQNETSTQIVRSGTTYCLHLDPRTGLATPAIIGCSSTRLKAWRDWNTKINLLQVKGSNGHFKPPIFGVVWKMTTLVKSNDRGEWHIPIFNPHPPVEDMIGGVGDSSFVSLLLNTELAMQAKSLADSITLGEIRGNYASTEDRPLNGGQEAEEIPF